MDTRILIAAIVLFPGIAFGTAQIPDKMLYDREIHQVHGLKLSVEMHQYFSSHMDIYGGCSANWDGYKATLVVKNSKLFITKLDVGCEFLEPDYQTPDPKNIFGVAIPESGLFASWFTGPLKEFFGKPFIAHTMSNVRIFYFEKGLLIKVVEEENESYLEYKNSIEGKN